MESFSTHAIPVSRKVSYWNEISSAVFARMAIDPCDASHFDGSVVRQRVGPMSLMRVSSSAVQIRRTRSHISGNAASSFLLLSPCKSDIQFSAGQSRAAVISPGDVCLIDYATPYELSHGDEASTLCLDIPRQWLSAWVSRPERLVGRIVSSQQPASRILLSLLHALNAELDVGSANAASGFCQGLLGFVSAALESPDEAHDRPASYRAYIDAQLADSCLAPGMVAEHFAISERQLRAVLGRDGETFSAYVLRRRLERSALLLMDTAWRDKTILDIALATGFSNPTHFAHVFKLRYGLTPRAFRSGAKGEA